MQLLKLLSNTQSNTRDKEEMVISFLSELKLNEIQRSYVPEPRSDCERDYRFIWPPGVLSHAPKSKYTSVFAFCPHWNVAIMIEPKTSNSSTTP